MDQTAIDKQISTTSSTSSTLWLPSIDNLVEEIVDKVDTFLVLDQVFGTDDLVEEIPTHASPPLDLVQAHF